MVKNVKKLLGAIFTGMCLTKLSNSWEQ